MLSGCKTVIVTLGSRGAVYSCSTTPAATHVSAPPVVPSDVVDTTGAGDAFVGALAYFLHSMPQLDLSEIIRR